MRYFVFILLLTAALVAGVAGLRGALSRRPPLEVFPDMKRQPRLRPQKPNPFFEDNRSSRLPVTNTVPQADFARLTPVQTGCQPGTTNWVEISPLPLTAPLLARGRERYAIYCAPCHSALGDGQGIPTKYGMIRAGNFHDPRLVRMPDGELFHVITRGRNLMSGYAAQVPAEDRWAIIAYLRALQRARLGRADEVPADQRDALKP